MSSLRNAHKKFTRIHLERSQPEHRQKYGFLEKKKDYKKRAENYQKKEKALKILRQKALDKNPNEFHFHMINSQLKDGRHYEKRSDDVSQDQLKLIQSQDMKYIAYKRTIELEKIEKLQSSLHMISVPGQVNNKHTIFFDKDNATEVKERIQRIVQEAEAKASTGPSKAQLKLYKELAKRKERAAQLTIILDKMRIKSQVNRTSGPKPTKSQDGDPSCAPVYRWQNERRK